MRCASMLGVLGLVVFAVGCAPSDPGITTSVKARLVADDLVKARNINVDTRDRVVTLTGTVQSPAEESKAIQIARDTKGVANVVDNMAIAPSSEPGATPTTGRLDEIPVENPAADAMSDAGITAKVKSGLLADPDVSGLRIDVDTQNRIVTLTGTVSSGAEKARAVEIAGKVNNVTRVDDRLTVGPR